MTLGSKLTTLPQQLHSTYIYTPPYTHMVRSAHKHAPQYSTVHIHAPQYTHIQGGFLTAALPRPKKFKYVKPRLGVSTLT